ncbi:polyketide synthase [Metarhizium album ARSEF 1941]|uniref:Polyketide synthase n=1 Tax=Metarhizium album (strain ARSEF 1941) TaxID=1081103 RepID=A0A0B2WFY9_METAS|nr:polyketide synthase [Metarhizium album ARSEF 1941]KHN94891.1 polyketide synthase [Metarhizium album ARSEF 1941]
MALGTHSAPRNVAPRHYEVLLFGDLSTSGFEEELRRLLHIKTDPLLSCFLEQVGLSLRRLIGNLPLRQQDLFPRFTTLIDLVSWLESTQGAPVLRFFTLCVYEIAQFIVKYGSNSEPYPSPRGTCIIGPCTGGFAAAAISCSQTLSELIPVAVEASLAAFRTALCSWLAGQDLAPRQTSETASWSAAVKPRDANESVGQLLEEMGTPDSNRGQSRLYVSATTPDQSTTISGPPSSLHGFLSKASGRLRSRYLDIQSPFHAPSLFDEADVDMIVSQVANSAAPRVPGIPFLSSSTGEVVKVPSFEELLRLVVSETLRQPVRWESVVSSCRSLLADTQTQECSIMSFSSHAASMLSSALAVDNGIRVKVEHVAQPQNRPASPSGSFANSKIAIIGYSGRFPDAASNEAFWELLRAGRDVHREIPADRFDWETHYDATGKRKNTSRVKFGCFIQEPGVFDAQFFHMSPREAENTDPAQRLAITTTLEAIEMAGLVRNRTPSTQQDRVGVFFGTTSDDWREVNSGQDVDTYFIPGGNRAFVPGRISYFFRFSGPSLSIDTACSSSFAAIQTACSYLWRGECDTAIAGGTNVLTNPDNFAGLDRGHFLSTTGNCNPFDDEASGYCRADAVGSVILKRLEDAEADHDPIFGVIVGTNTNHCGQTDSITRPHEGDQASVFRRIMRYANVDPLDIGYIEMHGTGTQAGDFTEMNSVLSVFVPETKRTRLEPPRPLYIGSAKANIGHAESASGVSSLIKVLMMMKKNEIPPHCGIKTRINHNYPLDLSERGVHIALSPTPWRREDSVSGKRSVFLNNFSAAGGNTAVLLEDAPRETEAPGAEQDPRPVHLVAVTAKSKTSLLGNLTALSSWLQEHPEIPVSRLSYTTTARRTHHNYRITVSGSDMASIQSSIKTKLSTMSPAVIKPIPPVVRLPKLVYAFTGQGTLYSGLGKSLYLTHAAFRSSILRMNRLAQDQGFPPFIGLVDGSQSVENAKDVSAMVSQLAITCVQMALFELWCSWGLTPAAVIGHSLGEYAAMYAAGVASAADTIYLVGHRAALLEQHCVPGTNAMLAVKAPSNLVKRLMSSTGCELACINQPTGHVVSGLAENISRAEGEAAAAGLETVRLELPYAFHSAHVEPILAPFKVAASRGITYSAPTIPIVSPLESRVVHAGEIGVFDASYLVRACRATVDYQGALEAARDDGLVNERTIWLEIGAHPTCSGMIKGTLGAESTTLPSLRKNVDAYKSLVSSLESLYTAGFDIAWNEYHRHFPYSHKVVELPRYSWDLKNYWIQYRNDFCLAKGEGLVPATGGDGAPRPTLGAPNVPQYEYLSPSVQRVIEAHHGKEKSSLLVESDVFNEKLLPVFQGHVVNGTQLCPSSLYADVALTVAQYMLQGPGLSASTTGLDVADVKVDAPLIAQPAETEHLFRASAAAAWSENLITMSIFSVNSRGERTTSHAKLEVRVVPEQRWMDNWKRNSHLIMSRIEALNQGIHGGNSHKMKRGMVYKLFGAVVEYSKQYQGMEEVVLDSERLEAVSTVNFQIADNGFVVNPHWIDSLGGIAGFIMNGNDAVESKKQVFINHGWERLRIADKLDRAKTYYAYNRMQRADKTMYEGDTYVLHDGRIVAIVEGVKVTSPSIMLVQAFGGQRRWNSNFELRDANKPALQFQGVPRQVLDHVLPRKTSTLTASTGAPSQTHGASGSRAKAASVLEQKLQKASKETAFQSRGKPKPSSSLLDKVLAIICEEVGLSPVELQPESEFANLGVDSLLSLTILARAREELKADLSPSLFVDCPTVGSLEALLGARTPDSDEDTPTPDSRCDSPLSSYTDITTPVSELDPDVSGDLGDPKKETLGIFRSAIAEETGVSLGDLRPSTSLADIGIDSILSLTIMAKITETFGDSVPRDLFANYTTLQEVEGAVLGSLGLNERKDKREKAQSYNQASSRDDQCLESYRPDLSSPPHATSILLSGSAETATSLLFLLPDGSGSASSYAALARSMGRGVAVYGLNCPWRKTAEEMTRLNIDMAALAEKYVIEIQRLLGQRNKPNAGGRVPFAIGGWSAGGIIAVEAARVLRKSGQTVDKLILLESPNPIGLQNPPERMYDFFDSVGIFGGGRNKMPEWLRSHFREFIRILDDYEPTALPDAPPTLLVYARDGVCKDPNGPRPEMRPDDPREMLWLLNNRTDFSASGWKTILGKTQLTIRVVDDVNHFSLMDPGPAMKMLGGTIEGYLC